MIGFKLGSTLLGNKKANRGFINNDKSGNILSLQEKLNIERAYYSQLELDNTYVSVNLLLLQPKILKDLTLLRKRLIDFTKTIDKKKIIDIMNLYEKKN